MLSQGDFTDVSELALDLEHSSRTFSQCLRL